MSFQPPTSLAAIRSVTRFGSNGACVPKMRIYLAAALVAVASGNFSRSSNNHEDWHIEREEVERERAEIESGHIGGKPLTPLPRGEDSCRRCHQNPEADLENHHACIADCAPYPPPPPPTKSPPPSRAPRATAHGSAHFHFEANGDSEEADDDDETVTASMFARKSAAASEAATNAVAAAATAAAAEARAEARVQQAEMLEARLEAEERTMQEEEQAHEHAREEERLQSALAAAAQAHTHEPSGSAFQGSGVPPMVWVPLLAIVCLLPLCLLAGWTYARSTLKGPLHAPPAAGTSASGGSFHGCGSSNGYLASSLASGLNHAFPRGTHQGLPTAEPVDWCAGGPSSVYAPGGVDQWAGASRPCDMHQPNYCLCQHVGSMIDNVQGHCAAYGSQNHARQSQCCSNPMLSNMSHPYSSTAPALGGGRRMGAAPGAWQFAGDSVV